MCRLILTWQPPELVNTAVLTPCSVQLAKIWRAPPLTVSMSSGTLEKGGKNAFFFYVWCHPKAD